VQLSTISSRIDRISISIGRTTAWLTLAMVLVTFLIVIMRYVFDSGFIWLQESLVWMHAAVFMLGAAYTLQMEEHVRVDIFYRDMSEQRRAWVNFIGVVLFVFPLCIFFIVTALSYAGASWSLHEVSLNAGGLPYPAIPLLKTVLIIMPVAVALQGLSLLLRSLQTIRER
jgi:TRAP-type mannitol/chloroaromatic compound transport system permease small subunit